MPFKFPASVEDINTVPEKFRGLYEADDEGAYVLDPDLKETISQGGSLSAAIDSERKKVASLNRELAAWRKLGETPDDVRSRIDGASSEHEAKIAELQKLIDEGGSATQKYEKLKADMEAAHKKALAEKDTQISTIEGSLRKYLIESAAAQAIAETKGRVKPLMPTVTSRLKLLQENGDYVVRVVDGDGDPVGDGKGGYLDIKGLVLQLRDDPDYAPLFEPSGTTGSGAQGRSAPPSNLPPGMKNPWAKDSKNLTEQMRIAKDNPALAAKLQAAAQ